GPRPALPHRRSPPRHRGEQRRNGLGRPPLLPALLRLLSPPAARGGGGVTRRAHRVLCALQGTLLGLPPFLGGRQALGLVAGGLVVMTLLALTLLERRRSGHPLPPGAGALAGFLALGLATALPLPPALID